MKTSLLTRKNLKTLNEFIIETNNCNLCKIAQFTSQKIQYEGPINPYILFVGDSPSDIDDSLAAPFTGDIGTLLRYIIDEVNIPYNSVGLVHAILCTPFESSLRDTIRPPTLEEMKNCSGKLGQLIDLIKPEIIVSVGKKAEQSLKKLKKEFHPLNNLSLILAHGGFQSAKGQVLIKKNVLTLRKLYEDSLPF